MTPTEMCTEIRDNGIVNSRVSRPVCAHSVRLINPVCGIDVTLDL